MLDGISSLPKPLILVVEDEAALATMLRYNLEKQGFRVEEAGFNREAHAGIKHGVIAQREIRRLMTFHALAVGGPTARGGVGR